jgi:NADH-quinone oxidoreductase subunit A
LAPALRTRPFQGFPLAKRPGRFYFGRMGELMQYLPVLMLLALAVAFSFGVLITSVLLGKKGTRSKAKDTPYECGMLPIGEASHRLSVRFHLIAMLFILFDIEVVFLYPWAVVYREMLQTQANLIFGSMITFVGILFVGYLYALKKGAFDWQRNP